jgi:hypothetical protein
MELSTHNNSVNSFFVILFSTLTKKNLSQIPENSYRGEKCAVILKECFKVVSDGSHFDLAFKISSLDFISGFSELRPPMFPYV